jgi:hypothetical protein
MIPSSADPLLGDDELPESDEELPESLLPPELPELVSVPPVSVLPPLLPPVPDELSPVISSKDVSHPVLSSSLKSGGPVHPPSGSAPHPQSDAAAIPIKKITSEMMAMMSIFGGVMSTDCLLEK